MTCFLFSVNPAQPVITLNNTGILQEGDFLQFNCSSAGGNPAPTITWESNGRPIHTETVKPSDKFGTTWSAFTRELTRDDHDTSYRCVVSNEANAGNPAVAVKKLQVQCKYQ